MKSLCMRDCISFSVRIMLSITYTLNSDYRFYISCFNITGNIRKALDDGNIVCGVFVDLQIAFYNVDHQILLVKLNHYGICGVSNDCFKSYLSNRNKYVSINGYESGLAAINRGAPQGSVLKPLLFLLYINDLNKTIKFCKVHPFADGTNPLCLKNSFKTLNKLANVDLKNLVNWLNVKYKLKC